MYKKAICIFSLIVLPLFSSDIDIDALQRSDVKSADLYATDDRKEIKTGSIRLQIDMTIYFTNNLDGTYDGYVIDHKKFGGRWAYWGDDLGGAQYYPNNRQSLPLNRLAFSKLCLLAFTKTGMK